MFRVFLTFCSLLSSIGHAASCPADVSKVFDKIESQFEDNTQGRSTLASKCSDAVAVSSAYKQNRGNQSNNAYAAAVKINDQIDPTSGGMTVMDVNLNPSSGLMSRMCSDKWSEMKLLAKVWQYVSSHPKPRNAVKDIEFQDLLSRASALGIKTSDLKTAILNDDGTGNSVLPFFTNDLSTDFGAIQSNSELSKQASKIQSKHLGTFGIGGEINLIGSFYSSAADVQNQILDAAQGKQGLVADLKEVQSCKLSKKQIEHYSDQLLTAGSYWDSIEAGAIGRSPPGSATSSSATAK